MKKRKEKSLIQKHGVFVLRRNGYKRLIWLRERATSNFWNNHWARVDLIDLLKWTREDKLILPTILRHLSPGKHILEGGCGLGQWVQVLKEQGYKILGIEFAKKAVRMAKFKVSDLPVVVGDVQTVPLRNESLSGYLSFGVVEHFFDGPDLILNECYRVLDRNGTLFISVPYFNFVRRFKAMINAIPTIAENSFKENSFYQFGFSNEEFINILKRYNFHVIASLSYDAKKGLSDEISFLKPIVNRLKQSNKSIVTSYDEKFTNNTKNAYDVSLSLLGRIARWLIKRSVIRSLGGHMMLYVARKMV